MTKWRPGLWAALRFALVFGLCTVPWFQFSEAYREVFHSELRLLSSASLPRRVVHVRLFHDPAHPTVDTVVEMFNPRQTLPDGSHPPHGIYLDSRSIGWIPQAMLLALIVATPLGWLKRAQAALWCVPALNLLLAITFVLTLWHADSEGSPEWQRQVLAYIYEICVENLWFSFLAPTAVWWLICIEVRRR